MNERVFPRGCASMDGHSITSVFDETAGRVVLVCQRCGDAVPLSVAIARTPPPIIVKEIDTNTTVTQPYIASVTYRG